MKTLDAVITRKGIGRVELIHPKGVLGLDGKAPNVKVRFNNGATAWFIESELRIQI